MERFKVVERETKTKAFSKEGGRSEAAASFATSVVITTHHDCELHAQA